MDFRIPLFSGLVILSVACTSTHQNNQKYQIFKYNESAGITSLDPAFARSTSNIWAVNQIFNGLVQIDDHLNIQPCIAKNWQISDNGLTYTFHLRKDVCFHDDPSFRGGKGRPVNAFDFEYSFKRLIDPKIASPGAWVFGKDTRFMAANDSTFVIRLRETFPPFLGLLTMQYCSVVPREAVLRYGADFRNHPVGTGPFCFKMWKEGVKLVMVKNPRYFETEKGRRLPYLDAISISFIIDKQAAFLEFVKGNLDYMSGIDASYKDELLTRSGMLKDKYKDRFNLIRQPYLNTEYLGFFVGNPSDKANPINDIRIRQAVNYGFDRVKMMKHLRNSIGTPGVFGFIPAGMPGYDSAMMHGYDYQPDRSRQLLAEAGYPNGKGLPPITLITNPTYLDLCKYIQQQLNQTGFDVRIDVTPPATLREMMAQGKAPFFRGSWIADYPDAENYLSVFYSKNHSPDGPNYTHYSNSEFDRLFEQARREVNDTKRYQLYLKMNRLVMTDAPVVVLYYDEVLRFVSKHVSGLGSNAMNLLTLKRVTNRR
ncbi:MAG: ABC transporter substrate-binding protein [Bacteroidota bacterium]|nr:ABC transporter substrate-binding protein [Bacteroidota bacterium]